MRSIERRIKNIEDKLHIGKERIFVVIKHVDSDKLPEPIEEWITYKQAKAKSEPIVVFVADLAKELEARENLSRGEWDAEG